MPESTRKRQCSTQKEPEALSRGLKRICLPMGREEYAEIVSEPKAFRSYVDRMFATYPELFPASIAEGYHLHDILPVSKKLPGLRLRRIALKSPSKGENGVDTNGVDTNGVDTNGVDTNGVDTNGVDTNGVKSDLSRAVL